MSLVLRVGPARAQWWLEHLQSLLPDIECRPWDDPGDPAAVRYAVVWKPPAGGLKRFPNLELIVSIGAGIDHVLADPELPQGIPIIRTTGDELTQRMREYVLMHVLRIHRQLPLVEAAQEKAEWLQIVIPPATGRTVGVMGLGNLGGDAARMLATVGFKVRGWSRSPKLIDGVSPFAGFNALEAFLSECEILVCLLPLTSETRGILNADLFAKLPAGASVINAARGEHLVEDDLLAALDSGHLKSATLDVFYEEPLPSKHPFWAHPKVLVTPHVASMIDPESGGKMIAANIQRFIAGEPIADLVDLEKGY
ncbi:2-hydroxyacid dehydrogenase [Acuticoccus kandeliae]|uniref:2-hydroxyacid dehydrogenase n=1 Tax=Acuticoccus kandeliae TaxID=2073160 RepID=UPI000D3E4DEF|nr:glyoxylate/hydroxypyruvate reductase A [Acuticoccus kandeliae]